MKEYQSLNVSTIRPSSTNPRRTFDEKKLVELAASIKEKGVLQPVIVRPLGDYVVEQPDKTSMWYVSCKNMAGGLNRLEPYATKKLAEAALAKRMKEDVNFELVAGERRFRACKLAKLSEIPALVRDLDDKAVAEIQVIENDQREDVAPLEQAEGYARLIEQGYDVPAIAAKIGRSDKYVTARLQLTNLIPPAKKDMAAGKLPFGQGHLLAVMDHASQRELYRNFYTHDGQPESVRRLREQIKHSHITNLSSAPWKWDDATLVPEAGACNACPKRTGARPGLFDELLNGDGKAGAEFCTDRACFAKKKEAFVELQIRTAKQTAGEEPLRISTSYYSREKGVVTSGGYDIVSAKEAKKAKPGELKTAVIVETDSYDKDEGKQGRIVQVRVRKETSGRHQLSKKDRDRRADEMRKTKAGNAAARLACVAVADKAAKLVAGVKETPATLKMFRQLADSMSDYTWHDAAKKVADRRGVPMKRGNFRSGVHQCISEAATIGELFGIMAELVAARASDSWGHQFHGNDNSRDQLWEAFGIDRKAMIREQLKAAAKPKKKAKASA